MLRELRPHRSRIAKTDARASPDPRLTRASPCEAISSSSSRKHLLAVGRFASDRPNSTPPSAFLRQRTVLHAGAPPGNPRQLVGEGDDRDIAMSPAHQLFRPTAERGVALGHVGQGGARSMDQLLAQVFVAALADPEQLRLAAGRELTGNQAEPRGEIAAALEACKSTRRIRRRLSKRRGSRRKAWAGSTC